MTGPTEAQQSRIRATVALAIAVLAVVVVAVLAAVLGSRPAGVGPLAVAAVPQPGAATPACQKLMAALPDQLSGAARRELADPAAAGAVAAWGDPATVLRCGVPTPAELTCSSSLQQVDVVAWLQLSAAGSTTYLAADRPVRVALTVPDGTGTGALQQISEIVAKQLAVRPVCEHGALTPADGG